MSMLICVSGLPDQEWKIGQPIPHLSGACTKFYADGAELLAINAIMALLSELRPASAITAKGSVRTADEIRRELDLVAPMAQREFSECELAQNISHCLSWCLGQTDAGPSTLFGWITTSMPKLKEAMMGTTLTPESLLSKIGEMEAVNNVVALIENQESRA